MAWAISFLLQRGESVLLAFCCSLFARRVAHYTSPLFFSLSFFDSFRLVLGWFDSRLWRCASALLDCTRCDIMQDTDCYPKVRDLYSRFSWLEEAQTDEFLIPNSMTCGFSSPIIHTVAHAYASWIAIRIPVACLPCSSRLLFTPAELLIFRLLNVLNDQSNCQMGWKTHF